jgi:hypothetical protein
VYSLMKRRLQVGCRQGSFNTRLIPRFELIRVSSSHCSPTVDGDAALSEALSKSTVNICVGGDPTIESDTFVTDDSLEPAVLGDCGGASWNVELASPFPSAEGIVRTDIKEIVLASGWHTWIVSLSLFIQR